MKATLAALGAFLAVFAGLAGQARAGPCMCKVMSKARSCQQAKFFAPSCPEETRPKTETSSRLVKDTQACRATCDAFLAKIRDRYVKSVCKQKPGWQIATRTSGAHGRELVYRGAPGADRQGNLFQGWICPGK